MTRVSNICPKGKVETCRFLNSDVAVSMLLLLFFGCFRHFQDCRLDFEKSSKLTFSRWAVSWARKT